jgi:hypothetical protein
MGELRDGRLGHEAGPYPTGLRSRLRSAADAARLTGAWRFASRVLPWSLARDYSIFSQDLNAIVPFSAPRIPCGIRPAAKEDIPAIMGLRPGYYSRAVLERRFEAGHLALVGRVGARSAYCHWALIGTIEVPYLRGRLVLGPGEALTDEIFVHPDFRRSGIYEYGSGLIRKALRERGFRTIFSAVASWNDVPRRVMIKSGMMEIARARSRNIPGFARVRWSGRVEVLEDGSFAFHALS